ncbi:MAG TPA: N-acetylmuramoyl-L-alanine amidase [Conexibacter sp.]|nr:N-acetylmuramoyl-L-alanine amidase [Conexibacter sp.]
MRRAALSLLPLALLAAAAPAAAARGGGAEAAAFERAVPGAATAGARWTTPALDAGRRFQLVGATWRGARGSVELRVRRGDGRWTRWTATDAGDPVWSGWADAVQLRGDGPLRGLRLRFVSVGGAAPAEPTAARASAGGGPPLVPRGAWDPHDACRPRAPARYGRVDFAIVHHTESLSSYTPRQSAAIVLGICLFHRDVNDWKDIGYDVLVDRYGTIFDGREGGADEPVVGAQAGGWNAVSTGVAMIGSYGGSPPPAAALRALERVLAWKLSLAGVPAQGGVTERSTGEDPLDNRWPRGAFVRFQRIAGHRDADATDCPGGALYALLPRIRRAVAALMPAPRDQLTLSPLGAPVDQAPLPLTGRLSLADGRRPAGVEVDVEQQSADGIWRVVATTRTGADGVWSAAPALLTSGALRAVAPPAAAFPSPIASPVASASVRAGVRLRASSTHVRAGGALSITGATTPAKAGVVVLVARRGARGAYGRPRRIAATTTAGAFAVSVRLGRPGVYRVLAVTPADALNAAGGSPPVLVRARRR